MKVSIESVACPACNEGDLISLTLHSDMEYKGVTESIEYSAQECDSCGSVVAGDSEVAFNNQKVAEFRSRVDELIKN